MLKGIIGVTVSCLGDSQWSPVTVKNTTYFLATAIGCIS